MGLDSGHFIPRETAMQRARSSINEHNYPRIWLIPLSYQGTPVWIDQTINISTCNRLGFRVAENDYFAEEILKALIHDDFVNLLSGGQTGAFATARSDD
jgi:hypothetical protein